MAVFRRQIEIQRHVQRFARSDIAIGMNARAIYNQRAAVGIEEVVPHTEAVGGAPLSTNWEERLLSGDRTPGFQLARVLKDLRLGAAAYADVAAPAPIFAAALAAFESAAANGHALDDMTTVV